MGFGGQSKEEKGRTAKAEGYAGKLGDLGDTASGRGAKTFKWFKQATKPAMDFWNTILSGNRSAISDFIGPEASMIGKSSQNALKGISEFGPRSGASAGAASQVASDTRAQVGNAVLSARPKAAEALQGLGSLYGATSLAETGQASQDYQGASGTLLDINKEAEAVKARQGQAWGSLGGGLGALFGGK